jgi:hypothetical protein
MSKERYDEIINEVYNEYNVYIIEGVNNGFDKIKGYLDDCLVEFDGYYEHFSNPTFQYGYRPHTNEEFINKCKINSVFSERWGLKIVERELSIEERLDLASKTYSVFDPFDFYEVSHKEIDELYPVPSNEIKLEYKNETVSYYE